jgi:aspartate/methionine/tyrosine aminotransferase
MLDHDASHLDWAKQQAPRYRHNLADSAVAAPDLEAMGLPHVGRMPATGYAVLSDLEVALASRLGVPGAPLLVTAGASEANVGVMIALAEPGDDVLVESPGYEPHRRAAIACGRTVRRFERPLAEAGAVAAAVERALLPRTRLVVLSDLHNPSGLALAEEDAGRLDELAERHRFHILCDETFREAAPGTFRSRAAMGRRWVATGSLTKVFGLGGLRIGWIAGSVEVVRACAAAQNALSVLPALPSVDLALALAPHLDTLRARTLSILATNRARWEELVTRAPFAATPSLGTTAWCRFESTGRGDEFAACCARHDLAVVAGHFFGDSRGFRVGLGGEPERFVLALHVLELAAAIFAGVPPDVSRPATEEVR